MKKLVLALYLCGISAPGFVAEKSSVAPNFQGVTVSGETVKLSDFENKVLVLDFWASWCEPCQEEFPFLIDLYKQYKDEGFVVIAINLDEHPEAMQKFLARLEIQKVPFPIISDSKGKTPKLYGVEAMPTTFFIDRKGMIRYKHAGFKESYKRDYERELRELLTEK